MSNLGQASCAPALPDPARADAAESRGTLFLVQDIAPAHEVSHRWDEHGSAVVPLRAINPPLSGTSADSVETIAEALCRTLRGLQKQGPYRLAGHGWGGLIAYEMALQLLAEDHAVEFLGLIDTAWPGSAPDKRWSQYIVYPAPIEVHLFTSVDQLVHGEAAIGDAAARWAQCLPKAHRHSVSGAEKPRSGPIRPLSALGALISDLLGESAGRAQPAIARASRPELMRLGGGSVASAHVICIPGAGNSVMSCLPLASALGDAYTIHGIQPRGLDGLSVPHGSVDAAAQAFIEEMDAKGIHGETHLIGHSFGGWTALAMAVRLQERGRPVSSLTLLDSSALADIGPDRKDVPGEAVIAEYIAAVEQSRGKPLDLDSAALESTDSTGRIRLLHEGMLKAGLLHPSVRVEMLHGPLRSYAVALRSIYRPRRVYRGPLHLVLAADPGLEACANDERQSRIAATFRNWVPNLTVERTGANHYSMLEPPSIVAIAEGWKMRRAQAAA